MKRHRQLALAGLIACVALFSACNKNEQTSASAPPAPAPASAPAPAPAPTPAPTPPPPALDSAAQQRAAQAIAQPAWLRERLPEHTVAYLRIPSVWGLLSAPNGRFLDPALASAAHTQIITALRDAVRKDKTIADAGLAPALSLLLGDLAAPVEVAVVDASDALNPSSMALVSAKLDIASVDALNTRLAALKESAALLKAPLDAEGKGALTNNSGVVRFDAANRRLYVLGGMAATPAALEGLLKQLEQTRSHPLHDVERQIDNSGQGLFAWISLKGLTSVAAAQVPNEPGAALVRDLLNKSQSLAVGWGTVNGHGRLQVRLEAPQAKLLGYLAARQYHADLKTAGKPRWVVSLMLPDAERLTAFESNLEADFGQEAAKAYRDALALLGQGYGITPKDLLKLVGPELIGFEDANGHFSALRVNDRPAFYRKLDELGQRFHWRRETLKVGKAEVQHLTIPGLAINPGDQSNAATAQDAALQALLMRMNTHLYWSENGPWLVFADVPQALADRATAGLDTDLDVWLKQSQGYAPEHALLGVSAVTQNAQRNVYYAYLGGLQLLGDLLGAPVSLADLPSAGALKLPVEGAIGFTLDATPDHIGLSISYEQTPVEVLLSSNGGAMTGMAIAGIAAAIAIPAYQDYTVRAQVSSVLAESGPLKQAMAEYYVAHGRLPQSDEELELGFAGDAAKYLGGYGIDGGAIVLYFGDQADAALKEHTLLLTPYLGANGGLIWVCGYASAPADAQPLVGTMQYANDIPGKYLPNACR